jgi:hypothetical protein
MAEKRFLVESYNAGATAAELRAASLRLARAAAEAGICLRGSTFLPDEQACFFRLAGSSADAVAHACVVADVPVARVHEVFELEEEA